ncbi:MAG: carboxypeptidase-like regulatory domain-containing protein [Acidobacteriaceae bacterium]
MLVEGLRKRRSQWLVAGVAVLLMVGAVMAPQLAQAEAQAPAGAAVAGKARVHGLITDPDGALIPGATVTLTPANGPTVTAKSGSDGTYSALVTPGAYGLKVTMPGFASYSVPSVKILASTTIDAKLQIGVQSQVVTVQANSMQLSVSPDSNASATVLTGKALDALSDDPDELSDELTALAGPSAGPNGGQIYVDGFTGGQLPPKSSIREIRINQNPFSAEFDELGYGRIEIFTKPGTDKLHGNFQIEGNPSQFNSGDPLTTTAQPPYHTIFSFGNLTGPVTKKASYNLGGSYRQIQSDEFTNAIIAAPTAGSTTLCAPGDATCEASTYQVSTYFPQLRFDVSPRVDLSLGDKNVLTVRYHVVKRSATNDGIGNLTLPIAAYNNSQLSNIVQVSDAENFNAHLISETRFEYEREHTATTALSTLPTLNVAGYFTGGGSTSQNETDHQDHIEVQSYNSLQLKKNFIRFGARLRTNREAQDTNNNTNGAFVYNSLASYQAGASSQFTLTKVNNHKIGDTEADLAIYAETDWKAAKNVSVSYGFRYETQNHLSDPYDIAPRVAFSYGLFSGKGAPKTVVRGGFGMFYSRFQQSNIMTLEKENGVNETVYTVSNPGASCAPSATDFIAACGATATAQTTYTATGNLRTPYITEVAIGADQQVGRAGTMSVNYMHTQGVHDLATQNIGYNFQDPSASTAAYQFFSEGAFHQNELVVHGHVQTKAVSLFGYYALNAAHGDTSGEGADISTPGNIHADYGRTTYDVRNRLFLGGSITLPRFIQFSPFMIAQSGQPYNITTGSDNNGDTFYNDRPDLVTGVAANGSTIKSIAGCGTFAQPGVVPGASVAPINDCTGPAEFTFNFRLTKSIGFGAKTAPGGTVGGDDHGHHGGHHGFGPANTGRRYNLAFGLEVRNLFNNEDLAIPQGVLSASDFGQSTQLTGGPFTTSNAVRRITLQTSLYF